MNLDIKKDEGVSLSELEEQYIIQAFNNAFVHLAHKLLYPIREVIVVDRGSSEYLDEGTSGIIFIDKTFLHNPESAEQIMYHEVVHAVHYQAKYKPVELDASSSEIRQQKERWGMSLLGWEGFQIYIDLLRSSRREGVACDIIDNPHVGFADLKDNSILRFLNPHMYRPDLYPYEDGPNPQRNDLELVAYGALVYKYYKDELLNNLQLLSTEEYELAMKFLNYLDKLL